MDILIIGILIFSIASCNLWVGNGQNTFDVLNYGAKGDGHSDDTQAFAKAWEGLCGANEGTAPTLVAPADHTFFVGEITFKGPCQSKQVHVQILGNLLAPEKDAWGASCGNPWLHFLGVGGLTIDESGVINGHGHAWWGNLTGGCTIKPSALLYQTCNGLNISGLTHINGPGPHISINNCQDVTISHVNITSPRSSRNTDGIVVGSSSQVYIHDSKIGTGDDCVAIKGGAKFLNISHITCGPGHGISIGSLGYNGSTESVENIHVWNSSFKGASYAARIKTWPGGKGYVKAITFEHIIVKKTSYSVYIDQHYMHSLEQPDAVKVSNITFSDIHGTCIDEHAILLDCANIGCDEITLSNINIVSTNPKEQASTICNNVHGTSRNVSPHVPCLH